MCAIFPNSRNFRQSLQTKFGLNCARTNCRLDPCCDLNAMKSTALLHFCLLLALISLPLSSAAMSPYEKNQLWLQIRRARHSCQPVLQTCSAEQRGEDPQNCLNQCISSTCFDQVYRSEPLELGEVDYHRAKLFTNCVYREKVDRKRGQRMGTQASASAPAAASKSATFIEHDHL